MKFIKLTVFAIISLFLAGCATGESFKAFGTAHESASKRGVQEAKSNAEVRTAEALASVTATNKCVTDACVIAVMGFASMKQMMAKNIESTAPAIAAPVDPAARIIEKVIDKTADIVQSRFNLTKELVNMGRSAASDDLINAADTRMTLPNPFATTP